MKPIKYTVAGLVLGVVGAMLLPSFAQQASSTDPATSAAGRTVTVTGTSTVTSAPDEAVVSLGVQTSGSNAENAMQENANRMAAVLRALADLGIDTDQIATTDVSLWPNYDNSGSSVTGYSASNSVDVTVRDMSKIGRVIDASVGAGANLTGGIRFQMSDENSGTTDALAAAVADAKRQAEALAAAGDASLGQIVTINSSTMSAEPPIYYAKDAAEPMASTPINPPSLETQMQVTVTWQLT